MMRIISGKLRGRRLRSPMGMEVRPTGDRLKETLFNILGHNLADLVLVDAFAGTGAIGIEALSRGARAVMFIERSPESGRLIRRNLELCGIADGYRLIPLDVFQSFRQLGREGFNADIIFLDPPYDWKPYGDLLDLIFGLGLAGQGSRVVIEHPTKSKLPDSGNGYMRQRIVTQSDHSLSFYISTCKPNDSGLIQPVT
jgi:16S rRNA (guanine966-N2)-methyltransferase